MRSRRVLIILVGIINCGLTAAISNSRNKTVEVLWQMTQLALKSHLARNKIDVQPRQAFFGNQQRPEFGGHFPVPQQSIIDVLATIAVNDKLQCIPKLLCEMTSDSTSASKGSSFLPINIDVDSFQQLLTSFNIGDASPIVLFGRAALLGYTSKGNPHQCIYAFPRCPRNADDLIEYLNNYNGGFFRFFNGLNPPQINDGNRYYKYKRAGKYLNGRIIEEKLNGQIKFPDVTNRINQLESPNLLVFPDYNSEGNQETLKGSYRKQKGFAFPEDEDNKLIFQKPLPNYPATLEILPDRTGTGELIIDSSEFPDNSGNEAFYFTRFNDAYKSEYRGK